jgi:hypothetical protein
MPEIALTMPEIALPKPPFTAFSWSGWKSDHTNPPGGLANYYRNNVIGGPAAFVMVAENSNSFGDVIVKKLIAEIAQAAPQQRAGN